MEASRCAYKRNIILNSVRQHNYFITQGNYVGYRGSTVVKVLCYKSEGRWFDPSWCHWNFSLT